MSLEHDRLSPLLDSCPATLPATFYSDEAHYRRELAEIWGRNWVYAGRANDLPVLVVRRLEVAGESLVMVKTPSGDIRCFHNVCRHRGAELCQAADTKLKAQLLRCPYHGWSYDLSGRLVTIPFATPTADFDFTAHGLFPVPVKEWAGFLFVCLADPPPDFAAAVDPGLDALAHWPMQDLVTGHVMPQEIACNWKIFWENYNECLHCPGIHPELCDAVPIYGRGLMSAQEGPDWQPGDAVESPLRPGARSWTVNGQPCGPEFPGLSAAERQAGHHFVTLLPTLYVVAHVDYVRAVSLRPLGPERTELRAEWLFTRETLEAPGFDLGNVTAFATLVMEQDGAACEMNQRGLKSSRYQQGRLMPQEFDVHRFQTWVQNQLREKGC
jgi:Rieske 2Fe-2S family protein